VKIFVFICLQVVFDLLAPLSSTPLFFAGFAIFGKQVILYHFLANLISFGVNFWIARIWGRRLTQKLVGEKNMAKVNRLAQKHGLKTLAFLRLSQWYLNDFTSYAFGMTKIKFWPYFLTSFFASLPLFLIWWFVLAPSLDSLFTFALLWAIFFIAFLLFVFGLSRTKNWTKKFF